MNHKKVSVLIPTYHSNETLRRAIDSVLKQTYNDFEVIVVDDNNPTDEYRKTTEQLMQPYADDKRVKYIQHDKNKNGSAARNTAFANSEGEYITFLDDDDFYYPDKLKCEVEFLEQNSQYAGCYCWRRANGRDICGEYTGDLSEQILSLEFTPCTRNSKVNDIIKRLKAYGIDPIVIDPWASERDAMREYGVQLHSMEDAKEADCVIVAVAHNEFKALSLDDIKKLYKVSADDEKVLLDVKGLYTVKALEESGMRYWRL